MSEIKMEISVSMSPLVAGAENTKVEMDVEFGKQCRRCGRKGMVIVHEQDGYCMPCMVTIANIRKTKGHQAYLKALKPLKSAKRRPL